jgi:Thioredoxin
VLLYPKTTVMNFTAYLAYHKSIIDQPVETVFAPYNKPDYYNYTKLNWSRTNRWLKQGVLNPEIIEAVNQIQTPQHWIIITEPWCGDAAHSVPFLNMMAAINPLITVTYELRDADPFRINSYLTRNGKSIPKLIIRDAQQNDLATWGPRPEACQKIYDELMAQQADFETVKVALQNWYNSNNGEAIQQEMLAVLKSVGAEV